MSLVPVLILFAAATAFFGSLWTLDEIVWRRKERGREARMRGAEGNPSRASEQRSAWQRMGPAGR